MPLVARLSALLLFTSVFAFPQQPTTRDAPMGRYQLIPVVIEPQVGTGEQAPEHSLFLLDTKTGQVWKLQTGGIVKDANGKQGDLPDTFLPIGFGPVATGGLPPTFVPYPLK